MKADRFEPRMAFGARAKLLGDLTLEQMDPGTVRSERRESVRIHGRAAGMHQRAGAVSEDRI
jgi:hypothetical protein